MMRMFERLCGGFAFAALFLAVASAPVMADDGSTHDDDDRQVGLGCDTTQCRNNVAGSCASGGPHGEACPYKLTCWYNCGTLGDGCDCNL